MTISKALKKLYTAMCGGETNKSTAGDLINAIADDYTGGGGDKYETVAEIEVGTMEDTGDYWAYEKEGGDIPTIKSGEDNFFIETGEDIYPLTVISGEGDYAYAYNYDEEDWTGTPGYIVFGSNGEFIAVYSDTNAIENTTVRILKKVGGETVTVDDELSETSENPVQNKVVTAALGNITDPLVVTLRKNELNDKYNPVGITNAQIIAAYESKRPVFVVIEGEDSMFFVYSASSTNDEISASLIGSSATMLFGISGILTYSSQDEWELDSGMVHFVPDYTSAAAGSVLTVNSDGELKWVTP